jgi:hypothetical protein
VTAWSLSDIQRLREEIDMQARFYAVEREVEERRVLGDDVYDFMTGSQAP